DNDLVFDLADPLPATITTDPARLRQVLINLIANALKFTPGGKVQVKVFLDVGDRVDDATIPPAGDRSTGPPSEPGKASRMVFEVIDNGIGIDAERLKTLFEPFVQADPSIQERFGGTGLGLSITKRLITALGGTISAKSAPKQGSHFTVRLPVDPIGPLKTIRMDASGESSEPETAGDKAVGRSPKQPTAVISLDAKVLIADDMRDVRFVAEHFLKKANCQTATASNGRIAVDMMVESIERGDPFQMVLMDMQMPELDGEGAIAEIRRRGIETPVIALTADAMKGTRRRLISLGFDEYLTKPLDVEKLLRVAAALLNDK
ncbi:MAG: ATP-binding protein, partial [Planctomycetota bacterium]